MARKGECPFLPKRNAKRILKNYKIMGDGYENKTTRIIVGPRFDSLCL